MHPDSPNILALNLASSIRTALLMLIAFMAISGVLLYFFARATSLCCQLGVPEGLQQPSYMRNRWSLLLISFLLTAIYLPLSTMAIHVLVWSDDLWVVPNPYVNATSFPPVVPPLGDPTMFRDPLNFCYTTTMQRNEVNYAPVVVIIALICLGAVRYTSVSSATSVLTSWHLADGLVSIPSATCYCHRLPEG